MQAPTARRILAAAHAWAFAKTLRTRTAEAKWLAAANVAARIVQGHVRDIQAAKRAGVSSGGGRCRS